MNMTDYTKTALYRVFELVKIEARRYGVNVVGSEIIGLVPMEALIDTAAYYLGVEDFSMGQVLEARIWDVARLDRHGQHPGAVDPGCAVGEFFPRHRAW